MFRNRISRICRIAIQPRRHSSQLSSIYPLTKLRAYPFKLSPEEAIVQLAPHASVLCVFKDLIGSLGARFLPGFGFEPLRPLRISPVYFPGWIIDTQLSAEVRYDDVQRTASGIIHDSYLPGSDFPVLSWVSYFPHGSPVAAVPFTKDLEVQHGVEINCLPYKISPFAALDIARSLSYRDATIGDVHFSPRSIETQLLAAYPVLFPLYLAQYELRTAPDAKPRFVTLFIEAFEAKGRIRAQASNLGRDLREMLPAFAPQNLVDWTQAIDAVDVQILRGQPGPFFTVAGFSTPERRGIGMALADWLNTLVVHHDAAPKLAEKSGTISSDADPRIRPFSPEEQARNTQWMLLGVEIESTKRVVSSMKDIDLDKAHIVVMGNKKGRSQEIFKSTISSLESKIQELEAKREESTPSWWKEWLEMSRTAPGKEHS
ncbi:hypothetical protein LshimejAT787_0803290 [Lyophyllum shimeji]|uniref:Uncharacterized protein n=1 Tax=Lyophyllum shimeji TaxID=47721 RepID=A0A9P3PRX2_LYOSH|nr:hypothetical protein LshimejAT787_0803290 [Lyophyllum shimeji]